MQMRMFLVGILFLGACGSENPNPEAATGAQAAEGAAAVTGVAGAFIDHWCSREHQLAPETALTVSLLVTAAEVSDCREAAGILAAKTELKVGFRYAGRVVDLRPVATLIGLKSLSLNYLEIDSVQTLMPLRTLKQLESLDIAANKLAHVRGLSRYTKGLRHLNLAENPLADAADAPVFSPAEVTGWANLETIKLTECNLPKIPANMPSGVSLMDFRKNAFTPEAFANLAPVANQPARFPNLKTILLQEAFPAAVPAEQIPALIQAAQSWMPEVHFKTF